jgi:hypothetical protein
LCFCNVPELLYCVNVRRVEGVLCLCLHIITGREKCKF